MSVDTRAAVRLRVGVVPGREWRVSGALLLALLVTLYGLHVTLSGAAWWFQVGLFCGLLLGVSALLRHLSRKRWLPPLVGAAVYLAGLTLFFAPGSAILGIVPTGETWGTFGSLLQAANTSITEQSLPATADAGITFLLCVGVGAIAWAIDLLALAYRAPALAGIPLVVLLAVPSLVSIGSSDPVVFVLAVLAFLLLLRVGAPRREARASLALAAVVVVGALIVPLLLPSVTPAADTNTGGFSTGVNPIVSLGKDLRRDNDRTVLTYSTTSGDAHYLRLVTVDNFTGANWAPDPFTRVAANTLGAIAAPQGLSPQVKTTKDTSFITVQNLTSPWLPLPYPTKAVSGLDDSWNWSSTDLSVRSSDHTAAGSSYRVSSVTPTPTPAQLQAAGTTVPGDFGQYLQLPADLPSLITDTAQQVAGGATSNYEKALLLQDYFTGGEFQYSETAPVQDGYDGTGMDVITQFLTAKSGYCIHFASAMAVMARSLGIPARISIGFLPGTELGSDDDGNTQYEVTSHDLHAWPELYFDGIGWTRFEPTVGRGSVPSYADPTVADVPTPINTPDPGTSTAATPSPSTSARPQREQPGDSAATTGTTALSMGPWLWVVFAVIVVLLLLLLPWPLRSIQRGRRLSRLRGARGSPGLAWREVLQSADDLGHRMPDTETPRGVARALGDDPALARLVAAVERESFAAGGADGASYPEAAADVVTIIGLLRSGATGRERFRAAVAPHSMWAAFLKSISRMG